MRSSNAIRRSRLSAAAMTCFVLAACGSDSGGMSTVVAVVAAAPTPLPFPAQTPSPTLTPTPTPMPTPTPTPSPTPIASPTPSGIPATTGVIVQAGDSIGLGLGAGNYAAIDHLGLASGIEIHNVSVNGQSMLTSYGRRATDLFPFCIGPRTCVLLIEDGTNDLGAGSSATSAYLYDNVLTPFVAAAKASGFYVAVDTILPRADAGWNDGFERQRIAYNALVRNNGAGADAVNDIAGDSIIGDSTNPAGSPYYADALHPTVQGQQRLAVLDAAVLGTLLQYPARAKQ